MLTVLTVLALREEGTFYTDPCLNVCSILGMIWILLLFIVFLVTAITTDAQVNAVLLKK